MTEPLTTTEAVPLGMAYLQQLLDREGVRCLAIKGPSFVELGVRDERQSNDIDLVVHPKDRSVAATALERAGWRSVTGPIPVQLEAIQYSNTLWHEAFPVTVDLHHLIPGILDWPHAFDVLWNERQQVIVAHQPVVTTSRVHAVVLEALNAMKGHDPTTWESRCRNVARHAIGIEPSVIAAAAHDLGAGHTAAPLLRLLGAETPNSEPPFGYDRWASSHRQGGFVPLRYALAHAPHLVPRMAWHRLVLNEDSAYYWAARMNQPYRGRLDVFRLRIQRVLRMLVKR